MPALQEASEALQPGRPRAARLFFRARAIQNPAGTGGNMGALAARLFWTITKSIYSTSGAAHDNKPLLKPQQLAGSQ